MAKNNKRREAEPGDLVFPDNNFLNKMYSDAFNHRCSVFKRPFVVVGKHRNRPYLSIIVPLSSKFYYNYIKLKRRYDLGLENPRAPSIILVSNDAHKSQGYYNAALMMDQAIIVPTKSLCVYKKAHTEWHLDSPRRPIRPSVPLDDPQYPFILARYEKAEDEWEKCTDKSLFNPKVNINLIVSQGRDMIKTLYETGKMETDLDVAIGRSEGLLHPDMFDF